MIRPGGKELTIKAIENAGLEKGAKILDIGCGEGDTVAILKNELGFDAIGCDVSEKIIEKGKEKYPDIDLRQMEGKLLEFESKYFDAVIMECSLSLMELQPDVIHEVYCVLKNGGKFIITDMFLKDPTSEEIDEVVKAVEDARNTPREELECGEDLLPSAFMYKGGFILEGLENTCVELGMERVYYSDESDVLPTYVGDIIFKYGSFEEYTKTVVPEGESAASYFSCFSLDEDCIDPKRIGYFLMILEKK